MGIILVLRRWEWKNQRFRFILSYIASAAPSWDTRNLVPQNQEETCGRETEDVLSDGNSAWNAQVISLNP